MLLIAMDRAPDSARSYDADGRLHLAVSHISKANICPYVGEEIPHWQELGLDGDRVYNLLRDPEELERAAPTFNNLPVLAEHVPVTAFDGDSHMPGLVVGSTGTDATFNEGYLDNSLVVWARDSIDGVVNNRKRQLSSAYRYRADMTPGFFEGVAYDGVMRDIVGNHVALVIEGRAGPDVVIGDEQPMAFKSKRALLLAGGLGGLIRPLLAQDAKFDVTTALAGVTDKSTATEAQRQALADRTFGLVQPLLAADSALTLADVRLAVDAVADMPLGEDDEIIPGVAKDEDDMPAEDADDEDDKPAMDTATVQRMVDKAANAARTSALSEAAAIRTAEREVQPVVGEIAAMDSAADVYRVGLDALGVDTTKLPAAAYAETFRAVKAARDARVSVALDSRPTAAARSDFNARYPTRTTLIRG